MKMDYLDRIAEGLERMARRGKAMHSKTLLPELKSPETRHAVAEVLIAQFERWDVHALNRASLLGLTGTMVLDPDHPLPEDPAVLERAGHLLAIDRALLKRYPYQPERRDHWITHPNAKLDGKTPLELMLEGGVPAIREVRVLAESGKDW
jgi:hypothetical protein